MGKFEFILHETANRHNGVDRAVIMPIAPGDDGPGESQSVNVRDESRIAQLGGKIAGITEEGHGFKPVAALRITRNQVRLRPKRHEMARPQLCGFGELQRVLDHMELRIGARCLVRYQTDYQKTRAGRCFLSEKISVNDHNSLARQLPGETARKFVLLEMKICLQRPIKRASP